MDNLNLERARKFFAKDKFATDVMGIEIEEAGEGYAKCSLRITEKHINAENDVMGGVMFTLADFAFAVAANFNQPKTVSLSCQISFLSAPRGELLTAEAKCVKQGHTTCYYTIEVRDDRDRIVTVMGVNGFIIREK